MRKKIPKSFLSIAIVQENNNDGRLSTSSPDDTFRIDVVCEIKEKCIPALFILSMNTAFFKKVYPKKKFRKKGAYLHIFTEGILKPNFFVMVTQLEILSMRHLTTTYFLIIHFAYIFIGI